MLLAVVLQAGPVPIVDNAFVRATRDATPCAAPSATCGRRIVVALAPIELVEDGVRRSLARGDVAVIEPPRSYAVAGTGFVEVAVKPDHPRGTRPNAYTPPEKNSLVYDGEDLFIFEEKLDPGDTRERHGHGQRLVVVINDTRLQQWPDGAEMLFKNQVPDDVHFNQPVAHVVRTVGARPLRNIVIEFKP